MKEWIVKKKKWLIIGIVVLILAGIVYEVLPHSNGDYMTYSSFCEAVEEGKIKSVVITESDVEYTLDKHEYYTDNPSYDRFKEYLLLHGIKVTVENEAADILYTCMDMLFNVIFFVIFGGILYGIYHISNKQFPMVKHSKDRFHDIAGMENVKQDMKQLVDLMKHPVEYESHGIRQPHGILLVGPPGNGKTLFARALAGEADMNFIATKATDFQSMYMSIGPAKVKALFRKARRHAPCIIFIDEFDGIGEKRSYAGQGIDKENNRIITAMLNELDGFTRNETGILVIAATNNVKDLDPALIRAGRFDRKYHINNPDATTRDELIQLYLKNRSLDDNVSKEQLIKSFDGFSCAQIETILNEAALIADSRHYQKISIDDLNRALEKVS